MTPVSERGVSHVRRQAGPSARVLIRTRGQILEQREGLVHVIRRAMGVRVAVLEDDSSRHEDREGGDYCGSPGRDGGGRDWCWQWMWGESGWALWMFRS